MFCETKKTLDRVKKKNAKKFTEKTDLFFFYCNIFYSYYFLLNDVFYQRRDYESMEKSANECIKTAGIVRENEDKRRNREERSTFYKSLSMTHVYAAYSAVGNRKKFSKHVSKCHKFLRVSASLEKNRQSRDKKTMDVLQRLRELSEYTREKDHTLFDIVKEVERKCFVIRFS